MQDFRKNTLLDELYERYLISYNATLNTIPTTGLKLYDFYQKTLLNGFRKDIKITEFSVKQYLKFTKKKRKHDIKVENLDFDYLSDNEYAELTKIERKTYNKKAKKYYRLMFKFKKLTQKYYIYLPEDMFSDEEEIEEESQEIIETEEKESTGAEDISLLVQSTSGDVRYESSSKDEVSTKKEENSDLKDERKRQEGLLEAFFGNENCGEKDQKEKEKPNE